MSSKSGPSVAEPDRRGASVRSSREIVAAPACICPVRGHSRRLDCNATSAVLSSDPYVQAHLDVSRLLARPVVPFFGGFVSVLEPMEKDTVFLAIGAVVLLPYYRLAHLLEAPAAALRTIAFRVHSTPVEQYLARCNLVQFNERGGEQSLGYASASESETKMRSRFFTTRPENSFCRSHSERRNGRRR